MTTHPYSEIYLDNVKNIFGEMFNCAIIHYNEDADAFMQKFIDQGIALHFEKGNPKYIAGKSGFEIAQEVLSTTDDLKNLFLPITQEEYWSGWALAQYQWYSNIPFADIQNKLPISTIQKMYYPFHEADITKFCETVDEIITTQKSPLNPPKGDLPKQ